jgi:hypothetical protein
MNAIIYTRVSTTDQAESGAGLAAQSAACATYAAKAGLTVIGTFTDAAISGAAGLEDRPGLMAAVAGLRRGDALVIAKRDRLGRDQMAVLMIEKAISRKGATIVSASIITIVSWVAFEKALPRADAFPPLGWRKNRTRGSFAAIPSTMASVPSVEPSSTTTISSGEG